MRPYTLKEFNHYVGNVGDVIIYRHKGNVYSKFTVIITEIVTVEMPGMKPVIRLHFGTHIFDLHELFVRCEWFDGEFWHEFGITE